MTTIESADPDGEHEVVWLLVGLQDEVFDRNVTGTHPARGDLGGRGARYGRRGPVYGEDVPGNEPGCDRSRRRAGPAPDLDDPRVRL
jgi:hypothetical protein